MALVFPLYTRSCDVSCMTCCNTMTFIKPWSLNHSLQQPFMTYNIQARTGQRVETKLYLHPFSVSLAWVPKQPPPFVDCCFRTGHTFSTGDIPLFMMLVL